MSFMLWQLRNQDPLPTITRTKEIFKKPMTLEFEGRLNMLQI